MKKIILLSLFLITSYTLYSNDNHNIIYCYVFDSGLLPQPAFKECHPLETMKGKDYYKISLIGNRVDKVEHINKKGAVMYEMRFYQKDDSTFLIYNYNQGIKTHLALHKKPIIYHKKVLSFKKGILYSKSYYKKSGHLLVKIFYHMQIVSGYKKMQYSKKGQLLEENYIDFVFKDDQVIGENRQINYFHEGKILSSHHFKHNSKGFQSALYYYKDNNLFVKEIYEASDKRIYRYTKRYINNLLKYRYSDINLLRERFEKFAESISNRFKPNTFYFYEKDGKVKKIEYYKDGIRRKIVHFNVKGEINKIDRFNRFEEKQFVEE